MKKALCLVIALILNVSLMGQGLIFFQNTTITKISTNFVGFPAGVQAADPIGTWYYALFRAASTKNFINTSLDPLADGWTLVAIGTNTSAGGRLSGNTTSEGVVVTPGPSTDDYAVAGWGAGLGTTWSDVEAFFGNSTVMSAGTFGIGGTFHPGPLFFAIAPTIAKDVVAQPTGSPINGVFGTTSGLINGFSLVNPTPEPSAGGLVCLGAGLLLFRLRIRQLGRVVPARK